MTFVRYLHLLAMAFFVGGQLFLVAAVVPTLRADDDRERLADEAIATASNSGGAKLLVRGGRCLPA